MDDQGEDLMMKDLSHLDHPQIGNLDVTPYEEEDL